MSHRRQRKELGPYSVGEIPRALAVTFEDADGGPVNLSGFTARFVIEQVSGDEAASGLGQGVAAITDAAAGVTEYAWTAADFATAGRFRGQMWVGDGTNRLASIEFWWDVAAVTEAPDI